MAVETKPVAYRVIIVEEQDAFRAGLYRLLEQRGFKVVGCFDSYEAAESFLEKAESDLALMGHSCNGIDGFPWIEKFQIDHELSTVILSDSRNPIHIARAYVLGVRDFVSKGAEVDAIANSLRRAIEGKAPDDDSLMHSVATELRKETTERPLQKGQSLTQRETQVMRHIVYGLSNREIARALSLSVETIKEHVQNMIRKLGAVDRTDAAVRAIRGRLAD